MYPPNVTMIKRDGPNFEGVAGLGDTTIVWFASVQPAIQIEFHVPESSAISIRPDVLERLQAEVMHLVRTNLARTGVGSPVVPVIPPEIRKWPRRPTLKQRMQALVGRK